MVYDLADEYVDGAVAVEVTEAKVSSDTEAFGVDFIPEYGFWIGSLELFFQFDEGITTEDIDANEPLLFIHDSNEVESTRELALQNQQRGRPSALVLAWFDKEECMNYLSPGMNDITVVGRLNSGRCYRGTNTINVFTPRPVHRRWSIPQR